MTPIIIVLTGLIATATTDVWQIALHRMAGIPATNWRLIGRWVAGLPTGRPIRHDIANGKPVFGEGAIGWTFHYIVGIAYAALFASIVYAFDTGSGLVACCLFGLATLIAPWLILKPALGQGMFSRHAPYPWQDRAIAAATHLAFGVGLFLGQLALGGTLPA